MCDITQPFHYYYFINAIKFIKVVSRERSKEKRKNPLCWWDCHLCDSLNSPLICKDVKSFVKCDLMEMKGLEERTYFSKLWLSSHFILVVETCFTFEHLFAPIFTLLRESLWITRVVWCWVKFKCLSLNSILNSHHPRSPLHLLNPMTLFLLIRLHSNLSEKWIKGKKAWRQNLVAYMVSLYPIGFEFEKQNKGRKYFIKKSFFASRSHVSKRFSICYILPMAW